MNLAALDTGSMRDEDERSHPGGGNVAKRTTAKPSSVEAFLERHSPGYQYGCVLGLLALTFIVMAAGPPDGWTRDRHRAAPGPHPLRRAPRLAGEPAAVPHRRGRRRCVSLLAAIGSVVIDNGRNPSGVFYLLNVLLVATVPWVIARALWQREGHRRAHRARRGVHLRPARDAVRVPLRRHRRVVERSVLRADRRTRPRPTSSTSATSPRPPSATATSPPRATSVVPSRCSRPWAVSSTW